MIDKDIFDLGKVRTADGGFIFPWAKSDICEMANILKCLYTEGASVVRSKIGSSSEKDKSLWGSISSKQTRCASEVLEQEQHLLELSIGVAHGAGFLAGEIDITTYGRVYPIRERIVGITMERLRNPRIFINDLFERDMKTLSVLLANERNIHTVSQGVKIILDEICRNPFTMEDALQEIHSEYGDQITFSEYKCDSHKTPGHVSDILEFGILFPAGQYQSNLSMLELPILEAVRHSDISKAQERRNIRGILAGVKALLHIGTGLPKRFSDGSRPEHMSECQLKIQKELEEVARPLAKDVTAVLIKLYSKFSELHPELYDFRKSILLANAAWSKVIGREASSEFIAQVINYMNQPFLPSRHHLVLEECSPIQKITFL